MSYTPSAAYVDTVGDTMTGPLVLSADPSNVLGAATKQYVDSKAPAGTGPVGIFTGKIDTGSSWFLSTTWLDLGAIQLQGSVGSGLTLSGGDIVIGSGITKALVSMTVGYLQTFSATPTREVSFRINGQTRVENVEIPCTYINPATVAGYYPLHITPTFVTVAPGYTIDLVIKSLTASEGTGTGHGLVWLTVAAYA